MSRGSAFKRLAQRTSSVVGHPAAFALAFSVILLWAGVGPLFDFNDTWQLGINTGTTIVTFLIVFLIQNTQNRDTKAIQIKLDELIRVTQGAHNALLDLEELDEGELNAFLRRYERLAVRAREKLQSGESDTAATEEVE